MRVKTYKDGLAFKSDGKEFAFYSYFTKKIRFQQIDDELFPVELTIPEIKSMLSLINMYKSFEENALGGGKEDDQSN